MGNGGFDLNGNNSMVFAVFLILILLILSDD